MNVFFAAFTLCISLLVLRASFEDLREVPLRLDTSAETTQSLKLAFADLAGHERPAAARSSLDEANEGLTDHELASGDPIDAWLDRYLTPPQR